MTIDLSWKPELPKGLSYNRWINDLQFGSLAVATYTERVATRLKRHPQDVFIIMYKGEIIDYINEFWDLCFHDDPYSTGDFVKMFLHEEKNQKNETLPR